MAHYESFLREKLKHLGYPNAAKAVLDAKQALVEYKNLKPVARPFGTEYHIPICIWLQDRHPYIPPLCYVVPTPTMQIKNGKHVDAYGRIYLPYLTDWKHPQSDLYSLIQVLCLMFAEDPPVFAKSAAGPAQPPPQRPVAHQRPAPYPMPGGYNMPYPAHGQPTMPVGPRGGMPVPGGGMPVPHRGPMPQVSSTPPYPVTSQPPVVQQPSPNSRGARPPARPAPPSRPPAPSSYQPAGGFATPYPHQGLTGTLVSDYVAPVGAAVTGGLARSDRTSFKISDEMMKASLKSAIEGKVKRRLDEIFAQSQAEMASLKKTETDLTNGKNKLEAMIKQIENEEAQVTKDIAMLRQKNTEIEELVNGLEQKSDKLNIDDAVQATTPLYNQILQLYAEENSLDDTMYYLGEGLRREKIELDVFLKHVRSLSRKQFMCRALLQKARKTAGLSAL